MTFNANRNSKDSKHKNFTVQVDKSLKGFEYSTEWADLISALGRLIKVIQHNAKTGYVPRGLLVGKRLAQCLHPALPPGVHCKALECYDVIFRSIGNDGLPGELPIYAPGLFTLLGPCAMTVKTPLFDIFEEHLLPLGISLHETFIGLLQSLLPGLEQGAEFFERGNRMLEMFSGAVGPKFFYTCLWKVLIQSPSIRQFGVSFITSHFNKRKSLAAQADIYGSDKTVLVESLCCLLGDSVLLVQRDALDFLQLALPIHLYATSASEPAQIPRFTPGDLSGLCTAALCVLLRRDASLNRRLFTWLRGAQQVDVPIDEHKVVVIENDEQDAGDVEGDEMVATRLRRRRRRLIAGHPTSLAKWLVIEMDIDQVESSESGPINTELDDATAQHLYFTNYARNLLIDSVRRVLRFPYSLPITDQVNGLWSSSSAVYSKWTVGNLNTERSIAERPFRIATGLLDRADLSSQIIDDLLLEFLWYTYSQYSSLSRLSSAWHSGDSTSFVQRQVAISLSAVTSADPDGVSCAAYQPPGDMLALILDHVACRDTLKPLGLAGRLDVLSQPGDSSNPEPNSLPTDNANTEGTALPTAGSNHDTAKSVALPGEKLSSGCRLSSTEEFLRTAHLFLNSLDSEFLWSFLERQLVSKLTVPAGGGSRKAQATAAAEATTADWQQPRLCLSLDWLCRLVRFLVTKLPVDTYPGVQARFLPRLAARLVSRMTERVLNHHRGEGEGEGEDSGGGGGQGCSSARGLLADQLTSLLQVLDVLVGQMHKYADILLDQTSAFTVPVEPTPGSPGEPVSEKNGQNNPVSTSWEGASASTAFQKPDLEVFTNVIAQFRAFFGVFCVTAFDFSQSRLTSFLRMLTTSAEVDAPPATSSPPVGSSQQEEPPPVIDMIHFMSMNTLERSQWLSLFAHCCRLLVDLANFPLLIVEPPLLGTGGRPTQDGEENPEGEQEQHSVPEEFVSPDAVGRLMRSICGDLSNGEQPANPASDCPEAPTAGCPGSQYPAYYVLGQRQLPNWFVCLMYAASEVGDCFDFKAIALYTLLELLHASFSVHGGSQLSEGTCPTSSEWTRLRASSLHGHPFFSQQHRQSVSQRVRLTFPVLSSDLLTHLVRETRLFTCLAISLWTYLGPEGTSFHEDVANLLLRLHQVSPMMATTACRGPSGWSNVTSSSGSTSSNCVEAFILSQMLHPDLCVQVESQARFALLWHLIRPLPFVCCFRSTNTRRPSTQLPGLISSPILSTFSRSIASPCWRRFAMGLTAASQTKSGPALAGAMTTCIPFYRCVLLLLDNLEVDNPWGPVGHLGPSDLLPESGLAAQLGGGDQLAPSGGGGLVRAVLREQSMRWIQRALRTGQADRLVAPLLAALLHPATVRVSLKARVMTASAAGPDLAREADISFTLAPVAGGANSKESTLPNGYPASSGDDDSNNTVDATQSGCQDVFAKNYRAPDMVSLLHTRLRRLYANSTDGGASDGGGVGRTERLAHEKLLAKKLHEFLSMPLMTGRNASPKGGGGGVQDGLDPTEEVLEYSEGVDGSAIMLPVHEHLVIHLQNYDANQVVYALSRLRAILLLSPGLFITALAACPVAHTTRTNREAMGPSSEPATSPLCLFGLSLVELLTRHRRALAGGNFYGPATVEELAQTARMQCNLLEVLVNTCLLAMCSQLPYTTTGGGGIPAAGGGNSAARAPSAAFSVCASRYGFTETEFRANKLVQKTAAEVLDLIVRELIRIRKHSLSSLGLVADSNPMASHTRQGRQMRGHTPTGGGHLEGLSPAATPPPGCVTSGVWLVKATLQRTSLASLIIHCLACATQMVHWPGQLHPSAANSPRGGYGVSSSFPTCLRLLLFNEISANLPPVFRTMHYCSVIRLCQAVLELQLWPISPPSESDRAHTKFLWPVNVVWPMLVTSSTHGNGEGGSPADSPNAPSSESPPPTSAKVVQTWLEAFAALPPGLTSEPIFRGNCLVAHWPVSSMARHRVDRDQGLLLMDILALALSPPCGNRGKGVLLARRDMHPVWYQFVFATLAFWGVYTPRIIRIVVTLICSNLNQLARDALALSDPYLAPSSAACAITQLSSSSMGSGLPVDYALSSIACLQSVYHTLLVLPGGSGGGPPRISLGSAMLAPPCLSEASWSAPSAASLSGLPQAVHDAIQLTEALAEATSLSSYTLVPSGGEGGLGHPSFAASASTLLVANSSASLIGESLTLGRECPGVVTLTPWSTGGSTSASEDRSESRETLSLSYSDPKGGEAAGQRNQNGAGITAVFTNRNRETLNQSESVSPDAHPLVQAQTELVHLMSTLISCLASVWDVFNQSPFSCTSMGSNCGSCGDEVTDNRGPTDANSWSSATTVPSHRLPWLTCFGSATLFRPALRRFIEPLVAHHPTAFLVNLALAWPSNLLECRHSTDDTLPPVRAHGAGDREPRLLALLTPSLCQSVGRGKPFLGRRLPLLPEQRRLLRFLAGSVVDGPDFGLILPVSYLVIRLRDLVKRPHSLGASSGSPSTGALVAAASSNSDGAMQTGDSLALNAFRLQVNLLHIFYAWLIEHAQLLATANQQTTGQHVSQPISQEADRLTIQADLLLTLLRDLISLPVAWPTTSTSTTTTTASGSATSTASASVATANNAGSAVTYSPTNQSTVTAGLPPVAIFIAVKIFNEFLSTTSSTPTEDKREQRELQELCHRIVETTVSVAASALEQPSWFRRTLQVRQPNLQTQISVDDMTIIRAGSLRAKDPAGGAPGHQQQSRDDQAAMVSSISVSNLQSLRSSSSVHQPAVANSDHATSVEASLMNSALKGGDVARAMQCSCDMAVQAMELLAEHMANFIDMVYRSDEKDRVPAFLTNVLNSIFPYLRVRMRSNSKRFTMASRLIASICSYQYTRRAWRREVLDLFFEPVFFQMSSLAIQSWVTIVDNLMTQDKSTFKEALTRLIFSQPAGLNLFSNKEAEYDQRAGYLKKLSFLIYSSEPDQYARAVPDLLERLTDCLRLGQGVIAQVHTQVFVFARVLLARMSPGQLISLWPIVIPELILVLDSLLDYLGEVCTRKPLKTDGKHQNRTLSRQELDMYLSGFKFLATGMVTPELKAPQFSFYRWVFINETTEPVKPLKMQSSPNGSLAFTPLITEVHRRLKELVETESQINKQPGQQQQQQLQSPPTSIFQGCLHVLAVKRLDSVVQLLDFLNSVENRPHPDSTGLQLTSTPVPVGNNLVLELGLEAALSQEFPETIASR